MQSRSTKLLLAAGVARPGDARALSFVDKQVQVNILLLHGYIDTQVSKNGFVYPARNDVKKGGALVAPVWPGNPWTGGTMAPGTSRGTCTYTVKADLSGYTLVGLPLERLVQGHRRSPQVAQERARRVDQGRADPAAAVRGDVGAGARRCLPDRCGRRHARRSRAPARSADLAAEPVDARLHDASPGQGRLRVCALRRLQRLHAARTSGHRHGLGAVQLVRLKPASFGEGRGGRESRPAQLRLDRRQAPASSASALTTMSRSRCLTSSDSGSGTCVSRISRARTSAR